MERRAVRVEAGDGHPVLGIQIASGCPPGRKVHFLLQYELAEINPQHWQRPSFSARKIHVSAVGFKEDLHFQISSKSVSSWCARFCTSRDKAL
jgi:hypothetical protein